MSAQTLQYRWTRQEFLRADDAGVFDGRVELVNGEVWPVVIGGWHGVTTASCARQVHVSGVVVTHESLVAGDSLPDPDVWVRPAAATETDWLSQKVSRWDPADVLLVVEVSDATVQADLTTKATLYGAAGFAVYWVLTREGLHVHTGPDADGYRTVTRYRPDERVRLPYPGADGVELTLTVADLLAPTD